MSLLDDEQLAIRRGHARFEADVAQTVRVIAERHHASGAALTGDAARAILEEALADVGLASRWPPEQLGALAAGIELPSGNAPLAETDTRPHPLLLLLVSTFAASGAR